MTEKRLFTGVARKVDGGWVAIWSDYAGGNFSSSEKPTEDQARAILVERLGQPADSFDVQLDYEDEGLAPTWREQTRDR